MAKEAYYFSHDANAQDDPKCMLLIDQLGMEGYGIFWALIEKLRSESSYKLPLIVVPSLAKRWGTSPEKVKTVIERFGLFTIEDELFFSLRLQRSMEEKTAKARLSASYRWQDANGMRPHCDRIANGMRIDANKEKESKVKESKEKEINIRATSRQTFTPPEKSLVIEYLTTEKNLDEFTAMGLADRWWNFYDSKNWMIGKNKMVRWKSAVNTWLNSPEFKKQDPKSRWL